MTDAPARPRWRILLTPRWLSWHLFAVAAVVGMAWLGDWQFQRAMSGNTLSWAYTFEWPIFAIFGIVFWVKTIRDELHPAADGARTSEVLLPAGAKSGSGQSADPQAAAEGNGQPASGAENAAGAQDDKELAEYNAYLAKLSREVKGHGRWHGLR